MRTRFFAIRRTVRIALGVLAASPANLFSQGAQAPAAAATYAERYAEISRLAPVPGKVADVSHLVLTRDAGRLTLERGKLYLLTPVGGRTVGAVFRGEGRFSLAPLDPAERAMLRRYADTASLDVAINEAILLFTDSTAARLEALAFGAGDVPGDIGRDVADLIGTLKGRHEGSLDDGVMGPLLNGETNGLFLAQLRREHGEPLLFEVDPAQIEAVQLYRPVSRTVWGANWTVVTQSPPAQPLPGGEGAWERRLRLDIPSYRMDVILAEKVSADIELTATAVLTLAPREAVGPWLLFGLHTKAVVDSARWAGEAGAAAVFKADESQDLWVRAGRRLLPGDTASLTLYYHGDLIDRYGDFFYVDPGAAWYPVNGLGRTRSRFDVTFHAPARYPLVSIGDLVDSVTQGRVRTTHWVVRLPTAYPTFNLGLFENYHVQNEGAPPLDVLWSDDAHRLLARTLARMGYMVREQSHKKENVAADVSNSLKLFSYLFGPCNYEHFYVTEIPYAEGVSFPGMIDLSAGTFQNTSLDGFDEFFRAHEAAHQWWGNGVEAGTYRDAWLSEGLASFSALMYLQIERKHNDEYYRFLDQYRSDILADREDVGPIAIGYRNASPTLRRGYDVVVYEKGAWVFHMLRAMMLDLRTMRADAFTETLRDYYDSNRGRPASTDAFRQVVERHIGAPMAWFFDEWVRGSEIPTYRVAWTSQPAEQGKYRVRLRIAQEHVPPDFGMPVLVSADLGGGRIARFRVNVQGAQAEYTSPLLPSEPRSVTFNDLHSVLAEVKMERW